MTEPINVAAIEKATKKSWQEWLEFFESIDAKNLSHKEIAQKVQASGVPGWWSQNVTVAYEQHIGRRLPGQDSDGKYQTSVSKTIDGTMDEVLKCWVAATEDREEFANVSTSRRPTTTTSKKWRHWYCGLSDGSRIAVNIYQKTPTKASLGLGHEKLESADQAENWRVYWKAFLAQI